jgi:hypothetical protein
MRFTQATFVVVIMLSPVLLNVWAINMSPAPQRKLTPQEALQLVRAVLPANTTHLPGLSFEEQPQHKHFDDYYVFQVYWNGSDVALGNLGFYMVDPNTGDVWNAVVCREYKTRALRKLQGAARKRVVVDPVVLERAGGFSRVEINKVMRLVQGHREQRRRGKRCATVSKPTPKRRARLAVKNLASAPCSADGNVNGNPDRAGYFCCARCSSLVDRKRVSPAPTRHSSDVTQMAVCKARARHQQPASLMVEAKAPGSESERHLD